MKKICLFLGLVLGMLLFVSCERKEKVKVYEKPKVKIKIVIKKEKKIKEKQYFIIEEKKIDKENFDILNKYDISEEFLQKTKDISKELNVDYRYILKIISFETQRTFSTTVKNRYSHAVGLIQFLPDRGKKYKTVNHEKYYIYNIEKMSETEQLELTKEYLKQFKKQYKTLEDLYMAVLYPKAIDKPSTYILFKKGTKRYHQNRELDINKDGKVSKHEITMILKNH